ncbi:MAG: glycosyltransferase family 4 protein [Actinomycetota bacterium]
MGALRIALDPWALAPRFRHQGTNVYARNLVREFRKAAARRPDVEFSLFGSADWRDSALSETGPGFSFITTDLLQRDRMWRLGGACVAARRIAADLMFSPSSNLFPLVDPPMVCTIHDATPFVMPSQSPRMVMAQRFFLRAAARRSRAVITVSERSKQDLIAICGLPEDKVTVVYNGYDRDLFTEEPADAGRLQALQTRLGAQRSYIFHHGVIQPRKNLKRLIEAWHLLLSRRRDLQLDLVLAGPTGREHEQVFRLGEERSGERGRIIFVGTLTDADLAQVLKGSALAVIPSLYEGFCLPMVEAMACGVPTIVSNNSCFPEISGNVLLYFDPLSVEDIAAKMESALCDSELRAKLRANGLQRASFFSWERCGRETLQVLLRAAGRELANGGHA